MKNKYNINKIITLSFLIFVSGSLAQVLPKFNLTTSVTGADSYQIVLSSDSDESDILWISEAVSSFPVSYPSSAPLLQYGGVYYARIIALKDG